MYLKFGTDYERKNVTGTCHTDYVASQNVDIEYSIFLRRSLYGI